MSAAWLNTLFWYTQDLIIIHNYNNNIILIIQNLKNDSQLGGSKVRTEQWSRRTGYKV